MPSPKRRNVGPPVYLPSALTLAIEFTVSNGGGSYTANGATVPYNQIAAGYYSFGELLILIWQGLRAYIFADLNAAGSLPTILGTVDDVDLELAVAPSTIWGGSRVNFRLNLSNVRIGGNPVNLTACTLKNNNAVGTPPAWPNLLGLEREGTDVACALASPQATALGQFQPRGYYCIPRGEWRRGPFGVAELSQLLPMGDGAVDSYDINSGFAEDEFVVVDAPAQLTGYLFHVGTVTGIDATRLILQCPNPRRAGNVGGVTGVAETGLRRARLPDQAYVEIAGAGENGWAGRVRTVVTPAAPALIEVHLWDRVPSDYQLVTPSPLYRCPDLWAARRDAKRLGNNFLVYGADDSTGDADWRYEVIALGSDQGGAYRFDNERRSNRLDRFSIRFRGIRKHKLPTSPATT